MAGTFTKKQAESYWNRYNKDGNKVLTVDEVKACIKEAFGVVEEGDVEVSKNVCYHLLISVGFRILWAWSEIVTRLFGFLRRINSISVI